MSNFSDISIPAFAKLDLPSAEEYRKRKVALISGEQRRMQIYISDLLVVPNWVYYLQE